jgi:cystathionine beta-lyase
VQGLLGIGVSPDDCFLALRGLGTLALRVERQAATSLQLAIWLEKRAEIARVLHPALESDPGHALWKRDYAGAGAVFSIILRDRRWSAARNFVDGLRLFKIGASWGGIHSLVAAYPAPPPRLYRAHSSAPFVRLSVGLEDPTDLIADLRAGLRRIRGGTSRPKSRRKL